MRPKKPFNKLCDSVTKFPQINENDDNSTTIEMDSLEEEQDVDEDDEDDDDGEKAKKENTIKNDEDRRTDNIKYLNLNGLCKATTTTKALAKEAFSECYVDEIVLPGESIQSLSELKVLSLKSNGIQNFPNSVLQLTTLTILDLSDNILLTLPPEISLLENLNELILDQNLLSVLPDTLWDLKYLIILRVAFNRLTLLPLEKTIEMRALILSESELKPENFNNKNGLTTLNLRSNRLKGNIILGNYGVNLQNLTELDVSENNIENLDLSSIEQLKILQCSRNSLTQLTIYGKNLTSIIAGNNRLKSLVAIHPPLGLKHLDVSYNDLESLPDWLSGCSELRTFFASNNQLITLPDHLFCNEMPYLTTLQLAYNQLQNLPTIQRRLPIQELFLQNNSLSTLPENFFKFVNNIKVLNISNNRLCDLPQPDGNLLLEKLFLTANCLIDKSLLKISPYLKNLKILHIAYNNLTSLPEDCANNWQEIEELVLSGNKILKLPEQIGYLKHLTVLRIHSNQLKTITKLSNLINLRVLDLAHNQLDRIDLVNLIPPNLKFLDLSCNIKLHVDSQQFNKYRSQRPMSLVDVSGKNRTTLPLKPLPYCENIDLTKFNWMVGFSETSGSKSRLYISQIRLPAFCNTEGLFGIFDGENNNTILYGVDKIVPRILLEERTVKETASDYMKYTLLSSHRELKDKGQKQGLNAIICHIVKTNNKGHHQDYSFCNRTLKRYTMKIASVGDIKVVLGRVNGPIRLLPIKKQQQQQQQQQRITKQIRTNPQIQYLNIPDPDVCEINLDEQDEFMIIANKNLWDVINPDNAIKEVSLQYNVILAAKRLQDLAQSYGADDNLSIIVVKFNLFDDFINNNDNNDNVDLLMKELRQTIKKNKYHYEEGGGSSDYCCSCELLNNECANCDNNKLLSIPIPPPLIISDDRSSPSGQSEHCSDCNSSAKLFINQLNKHNQELRLSRSVTPSIFESINNGGGGGGGGGNPQRRSYRGVAKAIRSVKRDDDKNDSDSALSEEQFKCWEYMLEQNTQLLFDKELNTLTRNIKKPIGQFKNTTISRSNPQISEINSTSTITTPTPFLSRQFGSSRSFNPLVSTSTNSRYNIENKKLLGGPNAAYFGSLQRLMPYNLEYDFAVMHERGLADSFDLDRMQQYWGVTTTEL